MGRNRVRSSGLWLAVLVSVVVSLGQGASADEPWLEPGPHAWGYRYWESTLEIDGFAREWELMLNYPATAAGEGAPIVASEPPFPVILFAHAGGSDYDWYDPLFSLLASRGVVVVSVRHNGTWHSPPGDPSDLHREQLRATIERIIGFAGENTSFLRGRLDLDRFALAGHSHGAGAAVYLLGSSPAPALDVDFLVLLAPCPLPYGTPISAYPDRYPDLPPTQVIYGSRDQDGCVARGQSIAIYEYGDRLRHYAYVEGASHHVFDDHGALGATTITREEAARAAASAIMPFVAHHFFDDDRALAALRESPSLLSGGPDVRYQIHEPERLVVDDFEGVGLHTSPAVVGVPGRTFVNGFLGDTWVDHDAGVTLIRRQVRQLLGDGACARVLFYLDASRGRDAYRPALDAEVAAGRICELVATASQSQFATLLSAGGWDLVVSANQDGSRSATHPFDAPLATYLCDGGRAIISDFRIDSPTLATALACAGARYDGRTNDPRLLAASNLFVRPEHTLMNPGWGIWSTSLEAIGTARVYAYNGLDGTSSDPGINALGLPVTFSPGLDHAEEYSLYDRDTLYWPTGGLDIAWARAGQAFVETLSDGDGLDVRCWRTLSLRVGQFFGDARNPRGATLDCSLVLTDVSGRSAAVPLGDAIQGPLVYPVDPAPGIEAKTMFETYRLPLDAFLDARPDLDLSALRSLAIRFDGRASGRLIVDDIEFVERAGPEGGDLNGDGAVDIFDVVWLTNALGRGFDLNGDGVSNALDAATLLNMMDNHPACP